MKYWFEKRNLTSFNKHFLVIKFKDHLLEKKFLVMQSPLCRKLFSLTCKNEFTLCLTLKLFLPTVPVLCCCSNLFANISLFYDTWIPTLLPNTEISSTF